VWLVVDPAEARALPAELRAPLLQRGVFLLHAGPPGVRPEAEFVVFSSEGLGRLVEGVSGRALEARWLLRHGEPLHDPLRRYERAAGAAARLPGEALESIVRPLFLRAAGALDVLAAVPPDAERGSALLLLSETASAAARLACVLDEGAHPPTEWLLPAARETRLGRRLAAWFDDLVPAAGGDPRAARWIAESGGGVLRELTAALRADFADREWLQHPLEQALRPGR
jgi:hypothetical protein